MFKRFLKNTKGNVVITTALMSVPIFMTIGAAVDTAELYRARTNYQNSVDAAALAAAKTMAKGGTTTEAQTAAERVFSANIGNLHNSTGTIALDFGSGNCAVDGIKATASLRHPMFFDGIHKAFTDAGDAHHANMTVNSEVTCGNDTVEIAMVLDNSGSMRWSGKLTTLRTASKNLVNTLHDSMAGSLKPDPIQFSIVPFSTMVNVGTNKKTASWMDTTGRSPIHHENINWSVEPTNVQSGTRWKNDSNQWLTRFSLYDAMNQTWKGCVEQRPHPYHTQDTAPSNVSPKTLFVPTFAPDTPDNWTYEKEKEISTGGASGPYCVRFRRNGRCRTWSDGYRGSRHPDVGYPNPDDYDRYGNYIGGSSGYVDGSTIYEESYSNNYIKDEHNWKYVDGRHYRDPIYVTTNNDLTIGQYTRQKWATKYFNSPYIHNVNNNSSGLPSLSGWPGGPNALCRSNPITDLTTSRNTALTALDAMIADGLTNVQQGAAWGWRTLSQGEPYTQGRANSATDNKKIMILMTDGNNTYYTDSDSYSAKNKSYYGAYGHAVNGRIFEGFDAIANPSYNSTTYTKAMDEHLVETCVNAKNDGIQVYSIAFDVPNGSSVKTMLEECASASAGGTKLYYDANDNAALLAAFENIAEKIAELAISR